MKVLFAVSNESISDGIIKKYQQMYKEIISSKNVYYFNAIIKELQKDKTYDRIVISEDLEPFASKNYDTIDNFLFEKLDNISDEASNLQGEDIPIILISTDRRTKGENILVKLFGIGVYSALIGQDRSIEQVCNLINKPRSKKEAKLYYKISSNEVEYKAENEGNVSEIEIQNILAHYKKLGKNEEKYVESFNSIANQYTDGQLRLIIKFLPLNVKAVLEANCPKYQQVVAYGGDANKQVEYRNPQSKFSKKQEKQQKNDKRAEKAGLKIESIKNEKNNAVLTKPVIIPTEVATEKIKKVENTQANNINKMSSQSTQVRQAPQMPRQSAQVAQAPQMPKQNAQVTQAPQMPKQNAQVAQAPQMPKQNAQVTQAPQMPKQNTQVAQASQMPTQEVVNEGQVKRGRGRPKKTINIEETSENIDERPKRGRGRPKKVQDEVSNNEMSSFDAQAEQESVLPGFEDYSENDVNENQFQEAVLPGFDDYEENNVTEQNYNENIGEADGVLPGFEDFDNSEGTTVMPGFEEEQSTAMPGFEEEQSTAMPGFEEEQSTAMPGFEEEQSTTIPGFEEEQTTSNSNDEGALPGFDDYVEDVHEQNNNEDMLPGFDDYTYNNEETTQNNGTLSGFDDYGTNNTISSNDDFMSLSGFDDDQSNNTLQGTENYNNDNQSYNNVEQQNYNNQNYVKNTQEEQIVNPVNNEMNTNNLVSGDQKIVGFVGTSKNGTSFIVDNLAQMLSRQGIKTAILDLTQNKNSYYIYTKNEEELRKTAMNCMKKLEQGITDGIKVNPNLYVYTSVPGENEEISNVNNIINTLMSTYSLILVDCDFKSDYKYIERLQELYLVQSMDVLTIQPLTAYLRDLKAKGVLDQSKLRIIINKYTRVRSLTEKTIIGGMAFYNDPAMSFMTELFNRESIKYTVIPFDIQAYSKYLEGLVNCEISIDGYSKEIVAELRKLANIVYPLVTNGSRNEKINNRQRSQYGQYNQYEKGFSPEMNNTLNRMKNNY